MTPEQTKKVMFVVNSSVEDAVRIAVDDPEADQGRQIKSGINTAAAVILWTLTVGGAGFLFGAAWRGAQIVGGL